jgi:uncharacterized repeat protein (TIGR03803 family)
MQQRPSRISGRLAVMLIAAAAAVTQTAQAQTFNELYGFPYTFSNGAEPSGNLLLMGGSLYGTTTLGGVGEGPYGLGTVYRFNIQTGEETLLHSFAGPPLDGELPYAGLIADSAGNLYGTTDSGGLHDLGTVFMLSPAGTMTLLHSFNGADGAHPFGSLVRDAQGNLYGTTVGGGYDIPQACLTNIGAGFCGTVFRLDAAGSLTALHRFTGSPDGANPYSGLLLEGGNLYGTTSNGGAFGQGAVFEINGLTGVETVLHSFTGGADGKDPTTGLVGDGKGNLYGTTENGGQIGLIGNGVVFMVNIATQSETVLQIFNGTDGAEPSGLTMGQGRLYGTAYNGGSGDGTVFELDLASGILTTLYRFQGLTDGANPGSGLVRDAQGNMYGATYDGGGANLGTIFRITP